MDEDEIREQRNAILGLEITQCFENLERNNNDWFRRTSWTWTLQESQRQADNYNCGLFLIRSIAHRINGEYPASIEDPLVERMNMAKGIAKEIGAPLAPSPSPPPTPLSRPSSSSGLPPPQPSSRRVHSFMPINRLGALPFEDDEEHEEGLTSSRVVYKWTNGYSYDLQPLMEADESELADAGDEGDYSNTKFKALSAPGTKLIQREISQEWFPVGWQEFHDQYVAIEDKPSARLGSPSARYGTGPGSRSCEMLCKLTIFEDAKLRDQIASDFAREAWIIVGDVAAVRAAFEDSQLIPDGLEQCRAYDEEASDTCKSLADLPRPREWVLAITNRIRSTTKRADIARYLAFRCDEGGLRHSSTVNNAQWSMVAAGYITRHVWYSMHLQGNIVTSHLNGFNTDTNPKVSLSSQSMSTWLGCVAIMTRIRAIAHTDRNATLKAERFLVQAIQRISGWNVIMSFEGELSGLIIQWKMSANSLLRERKGRDPSPMRPEPAIAPTVHIEVSVRSC